MNVSKYYNEPKVQHHYFNIKLIINKMDNSLIEKLTNLSEYV